jgi:cytochrome c553
MRFALSLALVLVTASTSAAADPGATHGLYVEKCGRCHGADRFGGLGPALLPENLERLRPVQAGAVIAKGRVQTQMPAFESELRPEEIKSLVDYVYAKPATPPIWGWDEIVNSRVVSLTPAELPSRPIYAADPLNLFIVVESGDHHATLLDGDRLEPIHRFPTRFALHGGPKFSRDARFVYFASRDGWITKYDLWGLEVVAEVRAGLNTRNLAISADGRTVMVANYLPHTLVVLDAGDLRPLRVIPARDRKGDTSSRVSAVYQAAPRNSFIVALKDIPEVWEISWLDDPPPVLSGLVHSYESGRIEAVADQKGRFPIRRIAIDQPLDDFFFDPPYRNLLGSGRDGGKAVVINLDVGRSIADLPMPGLPHLGSGITWMFDGMPVLATPNLKEGAISVVDMKRWQVVRRIDTLGPGFFLRSHENTDYAWVDNSFSAKRDTMQVLDKRSLRIVASLTPEPGKTVMHVEFTRDGRYALASLWEMDGALIVYDAVTLAEVKRIPMRKPSGKYNVHNKITLSSGTSH